MDPDISGTTALTTQSGGYPANIDGEIVIESLPDLFDAAKKVLSLLAPPNGTPDDLDVLFEEVAKPTSARGKRLKMMERAFSIPREQFGTETFIDVSAILRAAVGIQSLADAPLGNWRPDCVAYEANLATLVLTIVRVPPESSEALSLLQSLDNAFPIPFLSRVADSQLDQSAIGSSMLLKQTFDLALETRTQLALLLVRQNPKQRPDQLLEHTFLQGPEGTNLESSTRDNIKGWGSPGMGMCIDELPRFYINNTSLRIKQLHDTIGRAVKNPRRVSISDQLETHYPWSAYVSQVSMWARQRVAEIEDQVEEQGGAGRVAKELKLESERRQSGDFLQAQPTQQDSLQVQHGSDGEEEGADDMLAQELIRASSNPSSPPQIAPRLSGKSLNSPAGIAALKRREAARRQAQQAARTPKTAAGGSQPGPSNQSRPPGSNPALEGNTSQQQEAEDEDWRPTDVESPGNDIFKDPYAIEPPPTYSHQDILANALTKDKENRLGTTTPSRRRRFNETQPDAQRITWDSDADLESDGDAAERMPPPPSRPSANDKGKKRARDEDGDPADNDDDLSQDEGFQSDNRPIDPALRTANPPAPRRRRLPFSTSARPPPSGTRSSPAASPRPSAEPSSRNAIIRAGVVPDDFLAARRAEVDDPTAPPSYTAVQHTARQRVNEHRPIAVPQTRRPWSEESTQCLIEQIGKEGTKWSKIEELKLDLLEGRGQVALKDKARNVKIDFLRGRVPLPVNFENVRLSEAQKARLLELGVELVDGRDPTVDP